ncbi:hypothetical protein [Salibacterium aidingense]|uniref:hypothetical protein n=1 Tax=Salibacterium aidingense TaxID=384933 RepID=UPI003BC69E85
MSRPAHARFTFALRYRLWLDAEARRYDVILADCEAELSPDDAARLTDEVLSEYPDRTAHLR